MPPATPTLLWFRQDLRLQDNPALADALAVGRAEEAPIIPLYILDDAGEMGWAPGAASRWWLHHSLAALEAALQKRGSRLMLARGPAAEVLARLARETGARRVCWNRRYELAAIARDGQIEAGCRAEGLEIRTSNGSLLYEPDTVANKQGRPFQVFTPYWRHCLTLPVEEPPRRGHTAIPAPARWPASLSLAELGLLPQRDWAKRFPEIWEPGEAGAERRLERFMVGGMSEYDDRRDLLGEDGTSLLSPHLHFGEISPRQIWARVRAAGRERGVFPPNKGAGGFLRQLVWREFAHHLLFHFPHTPELPLRDEFARFPWAKDPGDERLRAWQRGRTGYPIVDAGMRQLWAVGWMHNRARMVVASFLVKHLRLPWQAGARWFWDTLVDADQANNTLGWQWSAGCGADAAPYFRIFAPVLQGQKFDPDGAYVRRWVPELARVPAKHIHAPWEAPPEVLAEAGVTLGKTYPRPIVDHATARKEALAAFQQMRRAAAFA